MKKKDLRLWILLFMSGILTFLGCTASRPAGRAGVVAMGTHRAVTPEHRHNWWTVRHEEVNERVGQGNVDLIFIGDSITQGWEGNGKEVWQEYYFGRNAVNLGFSGDRTQHVMWRLEQGNIEGIKPRAAVIMIGTNNSNRDDNTAQEIADGIIAICHQLRMELPRMKILLLAMIIPALWKAKNMADELKMEAEHRNKRLDADNYDDGKKDNIDWENLVQAEARGNSSGPVKTTWQWGAFYLIAMKAG